ncbi:hypothetical protein HA402_007981 [Bradysia odoriphaga]|nr:hypothetical protein HA402_007981 [Bradysia odoriphaga]
MVAQERFLGCPPDNNDACGCRQACCGKKKYIQPPPPKSFKPELRYFKPTVPMNSDTVYKNSFYNIGPDDIQTYRMKPYLPINSLKPSKSKIDDHTITKLSFPEHSEKCKRDPIIPHNRSLLGNGSIQGYTTQRHDYVAKPPCKRSAIRHDTNIKNVEVPLESATVQKLSFAPPDSNQLTVAKSFKPIYVYKRPDVPMEGVTTQKMSFMPVCPRIKEEYPWAKREPIQGKNLPFEQVTTYKLSYIPNSGAQKLVPLRTKDNVGLVTAARSFHDHTIYKESYFGPGGCSKRSPILPILQLQKSDAKMSADSVYNLSFPGHRDVRKPSPILPHSRYLLGTGPLDGLSTQRKDFVDKPLCPRSPIIPICQMEKADSPLENQTTMKLSFMKPNLGSARSTPIRPKDGVKRENAPMDNATIHKLSFVPVAPPKKENYPWKQRKTHNSEAPMDFNTTQHLSFMPPGQLVEGDSGCYCSYPGECMTNKFPKADSY